MALRDKHRTRINQGSHLGRNRLGNNYIGNLLGYLSAWFPASFSDGTAYTAPTEQLDGESDGISYKRVWRGSFAYSDGPVDGSYDVGDPLPDNAIIVRSYVDVTATFGGDGDDTSTIAITSGEAANDVVTAAAIKTGTPWDVGFHEGIQDGTAANFIKMTAASNQPQVVVDVKSTDTALDEGSMVIYLEYVISE